MSANIALALHLVFATLWVGGMAFAILALRPALTVLEPPQRLAVMARVHKRFFLVVWHAMPITMLSGYFLLFGHFGGFGGSGWHVHVMHLTGLIMSLIYLTIFFSPWKAMRRALAAGDLPAAAAANERIRIMVSVNLAIGLLTIAIAAWGRLA